jgi:hypothetical protein
MLRRDPNSVRAFIVFAERLEEALPTKASQADVRRGIERGKNVRSH